MTENWLDRLGESALLFGYELKSSSIVKGLKMNENFQICEHCQNEFDFNLEGFCTEGVVYSCEECTVKMLRNKL